MMTRIFLLALLSSASMLAQSTGTVVGTVSDSSGAVVPNAAIKVTNQVGGNASFSRTFMRASSLRVAYAVEMAIHEDWIVGANDSASEL